MQQQVRVLATSPHSDRPKRSPHSASRLDTFDIGFIEAVNLYLLAERATKHGALIIVLVFGALFMLDTLTTCVTYSGIDAARCGLAQPSL